MVDPQQEVVVPVPLAEIARPWLPEIESWLDRATRFEDGCPAQLQDAMRYMVLAPGKRLRPLLALWAAASCGGQPQAALPAAAAVELIHTYSLIHDDLPAMDDDDLRRGRPTCHVVYGEALAILSGDALIARAFELLAAHLPAEAAAACCLELARAAGATALVGGQVDDLAAEQTPVGDLEQLQAIHLRKTGAMLRVSLKLGGLCVAAAPRDLAALDEYGWRLGLAFQIVDDLLDDLGDSQRLGKRTGQDQLRGKLTFPKLLGPAASRERARQLVDQACAALHELPGQTDHLRQAAQFILQRDC